MEYIKLGIKIIMPRIVNFVIAALAGIALVLLFVSSGEPLVPFLRDTQLAPLLYALSWPNVIVFNLSVGYLSSMIFWILVVYLPDQSRRNLLRNTLAIQYKDFKKEIIQTLLWAAGESHDIQLIEDMADDHMKFKEYFNSKGERWSATLNGIQGNRKHMYELHLAMKIFSDEVSYVLNNVPINDPSVHCLLRRLNENMFRLTNSETDLYDQVKSVSNFLWQILSSWNIAEGQLEDDIVQRMIARI